MKDENCLIDITIRIAMQNLSTLVVFQNKHCDVTAQTSEDSERVTEREADEITIPSNIFNNCESIEEDPSVPLIDPWVKEAGKFKKKDKRNSKNKDRFFQSEWLKTFKWLRFNRKRRTAFWNVCNEFKQVHDNSPFVYSEVATGFCPSLVLFVKNYVIVVWPVALTIFFNIFSASFFACSKQGIV